MSHPGWRRPHGGAVSQHLWHSLPGPVLALSRLQVPARLPGDAACHGTPKPLQYPSMTGRGWGACCALLIVLLTSVVRHAVCQRCARAARVGPVPPSPPPPKGTIPKGGTAPLIPPVPCPQWPQLPARAGPECVYPVGWCHRPAGRLPAGGCAARRLGCAPHPLLPAAGRLFHRRQWAGLHPKCSCSGERGSGTEAGTAQLGGTAAVASLRSRPYPPLLRRLPAQLQLSGELWTPTDGMYTLFLTSTADSRLDLSGQRAINVDDCATAYLDGSCLGRERSISLWLPGQRWHAIRCGGKRWVMVGGARPHWVQQSGL